MIAAVLPTKPFANAKSRLANALAPPVRAALASGLFQQTLDVLLTAPPVDRVVLVGETMEHPRVTAVADPGNGLNAAVAAGVAAVGEADAVLVVPADLPLLTVGAIERLVGRLGAVTGAPQVVLAPDRRHDGTNALLIAPPTSVQPAFGPASFTIHREAASASGAVVLIHDDPAFALDLDLPEDLDALPTPLVRHLIMRGATDATPALLVRR
ncbi:MAG: hypothetical protein KatS3mg060_3249 [Dehalococcoidia bacterium]|nr:MAG: hypothetical protein KatS3mg060_3249 [Dehalococcoidia bacterium]